MSWPMVALGEVSQQIRGVTYQKADARKTPAIGYEMILRANNIDDEGLNFDDLVFVPAGKVADRQFLAPHDVVVAASSGSLKVVGKSAPFESDFRSSFGAFCKVMRPNTSRIDPRYFSHAFRTQGYRHHVEKRAAGANINNLRNEDLDEYEIPLPPLTEQRRIAEILDAADALRRRRREALALLDTLPGAIFAETFGDPASNPHELEQGVIGDLLDDVRYGSSNKAGSDGKLPILRMGNITYQGRMDLRDLKRIDLSDKDIPKHTVRNGDILFNRTNSADLVGKTAIFRESEPYAFAGYLVRARVGKGNTPEYVVGYLNSPHGKKVLRNMAKNIIGMANINAKEMQKIPILLAPKHRQESYAERCGLIENRRSELTAHLAQLDTLFASLQSRAFAGEL